MLEGVDAFEVFVGGCADSGGGEDGLPRVDETPSVLEDTVFTEVVSADSVLDDEGVEEKTEDVVSWDAVDDAKDSDATEVLADFVVDEVDDLLELDDTSDRVEDPAVDVVADAAELVDV